MLPQASPRGEEISHDRSFLDSQAVRPARHPSNPQGPARLAVEALEAREVPAVLFVNDSAAGDNNGHDWANAYTDLQPALTAAQSGDQIWVAEGTYSPTSTADRTASFVMKEGVGVYGGFAGSETALWQRNWRDRVTTLSGDIGNPGDNSDNSYHVVAANSLTAASALDGFTVTGGNANGTGVQDHGGGLNNMSGALAVSNMIFTGNSTSGAGGGIFNQSSSSVLTNVIVTGNTAVSGGGMHNTGGTPTLINVVFTGNSATEGGGLFNDHSPEVTLFNVNFSGNTASQTGGGLFSSGGSVTVTNSILWGNTAGNLPEFGDQAGAVTRINNSNVQGGAARDRQHRRRPTLRRCRQRRLPPPGRLPRHRRRHQHRAPPPSTSMARAGPATARALAPPSPTWAPTRRRPAPPSAPCCRQRFTRERPRSR